jgi:hypothetical protein
MRRMTIMTGTLALAVSWGPQATQVWGDGSTDKMPAIVLEVVPGSEQTGQIPPGWYVPDEHTSFLPLPGGAGTYLAFTGVRTGAATNFAGAVVMTTTDFVHFGDAVTVGYFSPVMVPLEPTHTHICTPGTDALFDDNYAAPGSVFPDPAFPSSWLMLYEAENHCRNDISEQPFYASVGVARSFDQGRTWPAASFASPGFDSPQRYEGVSSQLPKPTVNTGYVGDAIPSGLASDGYVYAYFTDYIPGNGGSKQTEVARAADTGQDPMTFWKFSATAGWTIPASARDGAIPGAGTSLVTPPNGFQCAHVSVHEVDLGALAAGPSHHLFVMVLECDNRIAAAAAGVRAQGAWFYATTHSLESQEWSSLAMVANTQQYLDCSTGAFDGWYPSLVSPGLPPSHLGPIGHALYLNGDVTGVHELRSRDFRIRSGAPAPFSPLPTVPCP